jgi:hypothetical protein
VLLRPNTLIGPGVSKLDFATFKSNCIRRISENFNVQFRAEFFNILNRANFASPTDNSTVFDQRGNPISSAVPGSSPPHKQLLVRFNLPSR